MKIAIDLNGVVRDIFTKTEQVYTKFYLDELEETVSSEFNQETEEWVENKDNETFEYGLNLPVTSMNLIEHFKFKEQEDLYNFFYVDTPTTINGMYECKFNIQYFWYLVFNHFFQIQYRRVCIFFILKLIKYFRNRHIFIFRRWHTH